MIIKRNVRPLAQLRHGADGDYLNVRVRVTWRGQSLNIPTGIHTGKDGWDGTKCIGKGAEVNNRIIKNIIHTIEDIFNRFEVIEKRVPDQKELKRLYDEENGVEQIDTTMQQRVSPAIDEFIQEQSLMNEWTDGTRKKFKALQNKLDALQPGLRFDEIDDDFLMHFVEDLISKDYKNTTITKNLGFIRWFLRWAKSKGRYSGNSHESFKPKLKGGHFENKEVIYLTNEELTLLSEFKGEEYLERVRDVFLFGCFSSLRYSDLKNLKRSYIHNDVIDFTTVKTYDNLFVNLNDITKSILEKYKDMKFPGDLALPVISNQKSNKYLKELCRKVGIDTPIRTIWFSGNNRHEEIRPKWQLMTFHVSRKTFVTQGMALGIPTEVIAEWTGHSSVKAMKPYMKVIQETMRKEMEKFNKL